MSKKVGIVTGGGDCAGLNAVIRAVAKAAVRRGWEAVGILGGIRWPARSAAHGPARLPRARRAAGSRRHHSRHRQSRALLGEDGPRRRAPPAGRTARADAAGHGEARPRRARDDRRRRVARHCAAAPRIRHPGGGRAEDDRQRRGRDAAHVRIPLRGGLRDRRDRPPAHDGREPQSRDGRRGDGPLRRAGLRSGGESRAART